MRPSKLHNFNISFPPIPKEPVGMVSMMKHSGFMVYVGYREVS